MLTTLINLFLTFTKIGVVGYGGGPAMIPLIEQEVVQGHDWMSEQEFLDVLAMGYTLPGPIATKMSMFVGYKIGGWAGGFLALLGLLWPSLTLMMIFGILFMRFKDMPYAKAMLTAVRPVVLALLAYTAYSKFDASVENWHTGAIAVVSFALVAFVKVHPALVILIAAILGLVVYR